MIVYTDPDGFFAVCDGCGASGPVGDTKGEAVGHASRAGWKGAHKDGGGVDSRCPKCQPEKVYRVAAWFYTERGAPDYELYETDEEAAERLWNTWQYSDGSPVGVQFADGTWIAMEDWPVYKEVAARLGAEALRREVERGERPKIPMRKAMVPWRDEPVWIEESEPKWLGR